MQNLADAFSLLFYLTFITYVIFGLYTLYLNPTSKINRYFFVVCLALGVWAFTYSMGNVAKNYEEAIFWRRVGSLGWGVTYSIALHFVLILTNRKHLLKNKLTYVFLYFPAIINVVFSGLYGPIAIPQYQMVQIEAGWINDSHNGVWDLYFNIYYIIFSILGLIAMWNWKDGVADLEKKKSALIVSLTYIIGIAAGTFTDIISHNYFSSNIPQLGVILAGIPIIGIFYSINRHGLMIDKVEVSTGEGELLGNKRLKFYRYIVTAFIVGSILNLAQYFYFDVAIDKVILFSTILLVIATVLGIIPHFKNSIFKQDLTLFIILSLSIVLIFIRFTEVYGNNIVWPVPLIFMFFSVVYRQKIYMIILVVTTVITQLWSWIKVPEIEVQVSQIDYFSRITLYIIFGLLAYFINQIYRHRLQENEEQMKIQRLLSEISAALVSVNMMNIDEKINWILKCIGEVFVVDRTYLLQNSEDMTMLNYSHEWCAKGILPTKEPVLLETLIGQPQNSMPLSSKGSVNGYLGFDSAININAWNESQQEVLKIIANVLSDALIKVKAEKEINFKAFYDTLTGLSNRTLFNNQLEKFISLANRSEKLIGILFLDLDSFKSINDTMGHETGDTLLKEVAIRLSESVRKYDIVCRFGGDEFLVMFPQMETREEIKQAVDKLMSVFTKPVTLHGQEFYITASVGVTVYPMDGEDAETLIKSADLAMYTSKDQGKNKVTFCSHIMKEAVKEKMLLTNDLYRAMEREELVLYYQPQVHIDTGKIVGLEALIRWQHPEKGMISPLNFISIAEQTGLIHPIGEWVLRTACRQNKEWQEKGLTPLVMAVNLSVEQFRSHDLPEVVAKVLCETGLAAKYLELEITEGIAIKESDYIIPILNSLKDQGVDISIDDFGTEYSSLSRLKELPIDRIKMAMEFVQGINKGSKDEAIAIVIINLAKSLGLRVIAEGVETKGQLDFLTKGVCDEVQGYYFHRPMPAAEVEMIMIQADINIY